MTRLATTLGALVVLVLLGGSSVPAADRMWMGFTDDPELRFGEHRTAELDLVAASRSTIVRTTVQWYLVVADPAPHCDGSVRPRLQLCRPRRVRPQRPGARARGKDGALGHATLGKRGPVRAIRTLRSDRLQELRPGRRRTLLGAPSRPAVRPFLRDLERVQPGHVPSSAVRRRRQDREPRDLRAVWRSPATPASRRRARRRSWRSARRRPTAATRRVAGLTRHRRSRHVRAARGQGGTADALRRLGAPSIPVPGQPATPASCPVAHVNLSTLGRLGTSSTGASRARAFRSGSPNTAARRSPASRRA